ncbi:MAG TPA: hypothetical protein VM554_03075 [Acidisarcina sp.]|nr:hypothetical protein [Acidisarcina sp.]
MPASNWLSRRWPLLANPRMAWIYDAQLWVELFVTSNLAVLAADIYLAHSVNRFRKPAEYIPLYFSIAAPVLLALCIALKWVWHKTAPWRDVGHLIGWVSLLIGLTGVVLHLQSHFFLERTLRSLTYAAPFVAPLAYSGLGFLLLMNRLVDPRSIDWSRWVMFLALGGFFGNFVLSLTDHASNGFFAKTEWIPVISSALATGFLLVPLMMPVRRRFLDLCMGVMILQALVGILGFWFHLQANLVAPGSSIFDKLVNGAPPMAPMLFPDLVGLALIGIVNLASHLPAEEYSCLSVAIDWFQQQRNLPDSAAEI